MKYRNLLINAVFIFVTTLEAGLLLHYILRHPLSNLLKGIPLPEVYDAGINLPVFFQWLWLYFPLWFVGGYHIENIFRNQSMTLLRYGKRNRWYNALYLDCIIIFAAYFTALCLLQQYYVQNTAIIATVLIAVHALFMWSVSITIREISGSGMLATISILLLETTFYTTGEALHLHSAFVPSSWGMYIRSNSCIAEKGFNIWLVIIIQITCCIFFSLLAKKDICKLFLAYKPIIYMRRAK